MTAPLALTDYQLQVVKQAAALPRSVRDWFLHAVSSRLMTRPTDTNFRVIARKDCERVRLQPAGE
jgi:hypothetical protein